MNTSLARPRLRVAIVAGITAIAIGLSGCSGEVSEVDKAQAQVTAAEKAVTEAETAYKDAADAFCGSAETYIEALDRYGDILNSTEPTVADVEDGGKDLVKPAENAFDGADAALAAKDDLLAAQKELADAQIALEAAKAGPTGTPVAPVTEPPLAVVEVPTATVDRVKQAESEFDTALSAITADSPLTFASEQFNAAAVALEVSWLKLFSDAGCLADTQKQAAIAAVTEYTVALQQSLTTAKYYTGAIDGVYGPDTVAGIEALQTEAGLPVTGTVDKATADALQAALEAEGGAATDANIASTAALQQTLKIAGFWDGPVDGVYSPALSQAVIDLQNALGVPPTGDVDSATIAAFEKYVSELAPPEPEPEPTPTETEEPV
jgi:peptidoglycan hydrolase-like protein with peptidoglycan-binding domain